MLGDILKQLRSKRELTQQQVADLLKINRVTYTQYELNKREPDNVTLLALADFFGVSVDELLGRDIKKRDLTKDDPDPRVAQLLKDNGIKKLELIRDVSYEELKELIEFANKIKARHEPTEEDEG